MAPNQLALAEPGNSLLRMFFGGPNGGLKNMHFDFYIKNNRIPIEVARWGGFEPPTP